MHGDSLLAAANDLADGLTVTVGLLDVGLRDEPNLAEAFPVVPALRTLLAAAAGHLAGRGHGIEPEASPELDAALDELRRTYHSQGVEY